jgi:hypothetical protein
MNKHKESKKDFRERMLERTPELDNIIVHKQFESWFKRQGGTVIDLDYIKSLAQKKNKPA